MNYLFLLYLCELLHAYFHCLVLCGTSLTPDINIIKILYFAFDLLSVIFSYIITNKNFYLVFIHILIHIGALLHLLGLHIFFYNFYDSVFKMGSQKWYDQTLLMKTLYIFGTVEDIITHLMNAYFISALISNT